MTRSQLEELQRILQEKENELKKREEEVARKLEANEQEMENQRKQHEEDVKKLAEELASKEYVARKEKETAEQLKLELQRLEEQRKATDVGAVGLTNNVVPPATAGAAAHTSSISLTTTSVPTSSAATVVSTVGLALSAAAVPASPAVATSTLPATAVITSVSNAVRVSECESRVTANYGLKIPTYKSGGDIENFVARFEQYCRTQNIEESRQANLILSAVDDVTFTVLNRELTETEKNNYVIIKCHLLKRFDVLKEKGQRRLILRQSKRKPGQDLNEFYTDLLGLAEKAYPGETSHVVDEAILDQFIYGCEDEKVRLHLLDKMPKTSRDALAQAIAFLSALRYNDSIVETSLSKSLTAAAIDNSNHNKTRGASNYHNRGRGASNKIDFRSSNEVPQFSGYGPNYGRGRGGGRNTYGNGNRGGWQQQQQQYQPRQQQQQYQQRQQHFHNPPKQPWKARDGYGSASAFPTNTSYHTPSNLYQSANFNHYQPYDHSTQPYYGAGTGQYSNQAGNAHPITTLANWRSSTRSLYFLQGRLMNTDCMMLCDTGAVVSAMDEEVWKTIKAPGQQLTDTPYNLQSASKHTVQVLGYADMPITLFNRRGNEETFPCRVLVVTDLLHPFILGIDFLETYNATITLSERRMTLMQNGKLTSHSLSTAVIPNHDINAILLKNETIPPRTVARITCYLDVPPSQNDDSDVFFEPAPGLDVAIATSIDRVNDNTITVQVINISDKEVSLSDGLVMGTAHLVTSQSHEDNVSVPDGMCSLSMDTPGEDWISKITFGDDSTPVAERERVYKLVREYQDVFSKSKNDYGRCDVIQHRITLEGVPKRSAVRPLNPIMREQLKQQLDEFMHNDLIQPSQSSFASPVCLVKKKDGSIRFCCDFRQLNAVTRKDAYPLPRIQEVLDTLAHGRVYSTLDLKSGYHQISMDPRDRHKTAFITQYGLFEWKVLGMGLCNAPATFERLMELIMAGLTWDSVLVYLDDVIVFGADYDQHHKRLEEVFRRLRATNLKLAPSKCHLAMTRINCLGHVVSKGEIQPDPAKFKLIADYPVPSNLKEVRSFVSLMSYYRRFIKNFAAIAKPLTVLTEKNAKFYWSSDCQAAFDCLRLKLTETTKLNLPDFAKPFRLACDASNLALGAVLSQLDEKGTEHPIAFASKVLSKAERNWTVTEREAYAIVWSVTYFRSYLLGSKFTVISDHKPLLWLRSITNPTPKLARWIFNLEEYDFTIEYKEGSKNVNADVMSRIPVPCTALEITSLESTISLEDITQAQKNDVFIVEIRQYIENNKWPDATTSNIAKAFKLIKDELFLDNDLLWRQQINEKCQVILPPSLHQKVLTLFHSSHEGGHLGTDRTFKKIAECFYWPNLRKITANFIMRCIACEKFKKPKVNTQAYLQPITTTRPWELLCIDFIGPLPETVRGNKYILSIVDHFTKFALAFPTSRQDSKTVVDCLTHVFSEFGVASRILSDLGRCFTSVEFLDFCKLWNVQKSSTTAYHPMGNGACERWNGTVSQILKRYTYDHQERWDDSLPFVVYAYNSTSHRVNEYTPYMAVFGRPPVTPLYEQVHHELRDETTHVNIMQQKKDLLKIWTDISAKQEVARQREKERYDSHVAGKCYRVGDRVLLFNPAVKLGWSKKFSPIYMGPYTITKQVTETDFEITPDDDTARVQIVHQNRLKYFHDDSSPQEQQDTSNNDVNPSHNESAPIMHDITLPSAVAQPVVYSNEGTAKEIDDEKTEWEEDEQDEEEEEAEDEEEEQEDWVRADANKQGSSGNLNNRSPTTEATLASTRHRPVRTHIRPLRYNASEFSISALTMKEATVYQHVAPRRTVSSLSQTLLCLLLLFHVVSTKPIPREQEVIQTVEDRTMRVQRNHLGANVDLAKVFGDAHVCGNRGFHPNYIALPTAPDCSVQHKGKKVREHWITLFFNRTFSDAMDAYACELEITTLVTHMGFWGDKSILDKTVQYFPISLVDCQEEVQKIKTGNSKLSVIAPDIYSSQNHSPSPTYQWCCTDVTTVYRRIRIRKFPIRFNFHNHHVISSAYPTEKCNINQTNCILKTATVVWEATPAATCKFRVGQTIRVEVMEDEDTKVWSLVSDAAQIALTGMSPPYGEFACSGNRIVWVQLSTQGVWVYFSDHSYSTTELPTLNQTVYSTTDLGMMQYITTRLTDLTYSLFTQNWRSICTLQQQNYMWLKNLMTDRSTAHLAARLLLKSNKVTGYMAGDLLQVQGCVEVTSYFLRPVDKCYYSIPIYYSIDNNSFSGFLIPSTRDIKVYDTDYPCEQIMKEYLTTSTKDYYLWDGHYLYAADVNVTTIDMVKHMPNIDYISLLSSHMFDPHADDIDILGDTISASTQAILNILRAAGTDFVTYDPHILQNAASSAVHMVEDTVMSVVQSVNPFFTWIKIIIGISVSVIVFIAIFIIILRIRAMVNENKTDEILRHMKEGFTDIPMTEVERDIS